MIELSTEIRTLRGIQQSLPTATEMIRPISLEACGTVYTKRWVVDVLLDLAGYKAETTNLVDKVAVEPSVGTGAFLVPMIERLLDSCKYEARDIQDCGGSILAFELDQKSADLARLSAIALLVNRGVSPLVARSLAANWVRTGDYLLDSISVRADFVIGNPPYVRLEDIPENAASLYRTSYPTMRGRADLYVGFFEAALHQLNDSGVCAFICADRWMRNQYGAELRRLITSSFAVETVVEMHRADAFHDEVDAYPAITVIRRKRQGMTTVASANSELEQTPPSCITTLLMSPESIQSNPVRGLTTARVNSWFRGTDPWPCTSPEQLNLLRRLEDQFSTLESAARVGIGVATGKDKIFITKDPHLVEASRLLKLALAKDIRNGTMSWSGHYLVNPWNCEGLVKLDEYPKLKAYLGKHEQVIRTRHTAVNSCEKWYKTIDRVSHELTVRAKLYIADIKEQLNPVLDRGETYPHHNLYFIESDNWDIEALGGLLISNVAQFFIECYAVRMRGGYLRFQAQYLRRIRVPDPRSLSVVQIQKLIQAFKSRDRELATEAAMEIYRIDGREREMLLGY